MADGVAWCIEEVKGSVFEVVYCWKVADFQSGGWKVELDQSAIGKIGLHDGAIWISGIAWKKVGLEAGSDDEVS